LLPLPTCGSALFPYTTLFRSDFHAAAVEALHILAEAERRELEAICAKGVGFDDLRARFDIRLVNAEDRFRLGGIQFVETALRAQDRKSTRLNSRENLVCRLLL